MGTSKQIFHLGIAIIVVILVSALDVARCQTATPNLYVAKENLTEEWKLPVGALFFKQTVDEDWYKLPYDKRELMQVGTMSKELFVVLPSSETADILKRGSVETIDEGNQQELLREKTLNEWSYALRPEWLPQPETVTVADLTRRSGSMETIAYSSFRRAAANGLYSATVGKDFWLYIEQPDQLPEGGKPLSISDVIRADLFQTSQGSDGEKFYPRAGIQSREFVRYRAYLPTGPYERVRILLIHCRSPRTLSLQAFGYPGQ